MFLRHRNKDIRGSAALRTGLGGIRPERRSAALGSSLAPHYNPRPMPERKRFAVVGTGGRSMTFTHALAGPHREHNQLVGFCDPSPTRMAYHNRVLAEQFNHPPVPTFDDFDRMVKETRPHT